MTETVSIGRQFVQGTITIPASKSYMQRACAAALLKGGTTLVHHYGKSNDDKIAIQIIQQLGATVHYERNAIAIEAPIYGTNVKNSSIHFGESGLSARMFTPIITLLSNEINITAEGSLLNRPMHLFETILPTLGVQFKSNEGKLPFTIKGPLQPTNLTIDGTLSSQFLTGLLMTYSYANVNATITVNNLVSKPYIDITLDVLKDFGLNLPVHEDYQNFIFEKQSIQSSNLLNYSIESDWSSASFIMVAAAINGNITCKGLNILSKQADKKILEAMQSARVLLSISENEITVRKSNIQPFYFDASHCPDLFPPLVALASYANGNSVIKGISRLVYKESNRAVTLQQEFSKIGIAISLQNDEMIIKSNGSPKVNQQNCNSQNDHRIAMALAVGALGLDQKIMIHNADAVNKSYPTFFDDLKKLYVND